MKTEEFKRFVELEQRLGQSGHVGPFTKDLRELRGKYKAITEHASLDVYMELEAMRLQDPETAAAKFGQLKNFNAVRRAS